MDVPTVPSYYITCNGTLLVVVEVSSLGRSAFSEQENLKVLFKTSYPNSTDELDKPVLSDPSVSWLSGACYGKKEWDRFGSTMKLRQITEDQGRCVLQFVGRYPV